MPTTEGGIDAGVGRTALMVAAARAIETHRADSLARDEYAEHFVRAARASADWPVRPDQVTDDDPLWGRLARYFGLRTRVFDDFLLGSAHAGTRQVVLFGAGLDSRALRLDWPAGVTVFELDREPVLAFKQRVLDDLGASHRATRVPVAVDLGHDWSPALAAAGFAPGLPTAWLAEGLVMYLTPTAERRLVDAVDRLSAPAGALVYETKQRPTAPNIVHHPLYTGTRTRIGVDLISLFDAGPRPDSAADLTGRGWSTTTRVPFEFTTRHGFRLRREANDPLDDNRWVFAEKPRESRGPQESERPG
ncbi:SAM-dependent methyltransferase [Saccharothrix xinjiangensis]|uniref:S-adenosyl-L-methionine-dependent methyltransferase n=1 Tax=Saccharothrix xinjiangensis TaxID=204798 RepID=A0ABV9XSM4_9PSEU